MLVVFYGDGKCSNLRQQLKIFVKCSSVVLGVLRRVVLEI